MSTRAIGFDLGGTLLDYSGLPASWEGEYPAAVAAVAALWEHAPSASQLAAAMDVLREFNTRIHPRRREVDHLTVFGRLVEALEAPAECRRVLVEHAADAFFDMFRQWVVALPGAAVTIASLGEAATPFGVLTDVPYGMPRRCLLGHVAASGLGVPSAALLSSVDVGTRKPDPHGFACLAELLGCEPEEMLFVGDEDKDVQGAQAAGMCPVLFWPGEDVAPEWGQRLTVGRLEALLPAVGLR